MKVDAVALAGTTRHGNTPVEISAADKPAKVHGEHYAVARSIALAGSARIRDDSFQHQQAIIAVYFLTPPIGYG